MMQCSECEYFHRRSDGTVGFACDPFSTIKEPHCLVKWQLIKLDTMVRAYEATVQMYQRMAPMQEKMLRHMEREMEDVDEADAWKYSSDDDGEDDEDEDPHAGP